MRRGLPRIGDLLLTTEAPLGNAALVDREDVALAQRVIRFRLDPRILLSRFALYSVLSAYFQDQILCRGTGSTAMGIKASKLPQLLILCPPVPEQQRIVERIAQQTGPIDQRRDQIGRSLDLVREARTRLTADVVTGKLDVRELATRLPEPDAPESIDTDDGSAEPVGEASGPAEGCAEIDEDEA